MRVQSYKIYLTYALVRKNGSIIVINCSITDVKIIGELYCEGTFCTGRLECYGVILVNIYVIARGV